MSGIENALGRFAELTRDTPESEVREVVDLVVAEIVAGIEGTADLGAARRNVAALLSYLRGSGNARHPGRVQLAIALSEKVIPRLYSDEATAEVPRTAYRYERAERAARERTIAMFDTALAFLRAEHDRHPCHGEDVLEDVLPPFCIFSPLFRDGIDRCLGVLFERFLRSKQTETNLYAPLLEAMGGRDRPDPAAYQRFDPVIRKTVTAALGFAGRKFRTIPNANLLDMDEVRRDQQAEQVFTYEQITTLEAIERLRLHGQEAGYFVHQELDFELLETLFNFRPRPLISGVEEIRNAIVNGETGQYVIRQIDRLNDTHDLNVFDMSVLTVFFFGDERHRLSFKTLHDTCIGAASSKAGMEALRPMLAAELSRRPQQLARRIADIAMSPDYDEERFAAVLNRFMDAMAALNALRFSDEIFSSVSLLWGMPVCKPLIEWIQEKDRDPDRIDDYSDAVLDLREELLKVA